MYILLLIILFSQKKHLKYVVLPWGKSKPRVLNLPIIEHWWENLILCGLFKSHGLLISDTGMLVCKWQQRVLNSPASALLLGAHEMQELICQRLYRGEIVQLIEKCHQNNYAIYSGTSCNMLTRGYRTCKIWESVQQTMRRFLSKLNFLTNDQQHNSINRTPHDMFTCFKGNKHLNI